VHCRLGNNSHIAQPQHAATHNEAAPSQRSEEVFQPALGGSGGYETMA